MLLNPPHRRPALWGAGRGETERNGLTRGSLWWPEGRLPGDAHIPVPDLRGSCLTPRRGRLLIR